MCCAGTQVPAGYDSLLLMYPKSDCLRYDVPYLGTSSNAFIPKICSTPRCRTVLRYGWKVR